MRYVITGASSGLGFQLAKQCVELGSVISISRKPGKLSQLQGAKHPVMHYECDFSTDNSSVEEIADVVYKRELNGCEFKLILNAAQFHMQDVASMAEAARRIFEVNYFSQIELLKALNREGLKRVMFINSISGTHGQQNQFQYSSSKHAMQGFVDSLLQSANQYDFDVININPGGMKTELWDRQTINREKHDRFFEPNHIASMLMSLVEFPGKVFVKSFELLPEGDVR